MKACNLNHLWGKLIVAEFVRNGINEFCISPGSRSTPLAIAVAERGDIHSTVHVDERGSAFLALGFAKATGRPAVLICTSGTALANFYPAVIEASQSATPLIILSADRPSELRECGAAQTINQVNILGSYLRWSYDLHPPDEQIKPEFVLSTIDHAIHRALNAPAGPVQVNCQFREPLAPLGPFQDFTRYTESITAWLRGSSPYTATVQATALCSAGDVKVVADAAHSAKRGIIVAGTLPSHVDATPILRLAEKWQWPVIADICSGARFSGAHRPNVICHADLFLRPEHLQTQLRPDVVLQFGTIPISKSVMQYAGRASEQYILVANRPDRSDPLHKVTCQVSADPAALAETLAMESDIPSSNLLSIFLKYDEIAERCIHATVGTGNKGLSELQIVNEVFRTLTTSRGVFLATSMPMREADAITRQSDAHLKVAANRGVNGIDGTIASAVGFSDGLKLPVTLVIGDLAALHDLNSLLLVRDSRYPVTVVVLNNDGGGIFSMLPVAALGAHFEKFFGTPHGRDFRNAAEMFGLKYHCPATTNDFTTVYRHSLRSKKSALIEVRCSRTENVGEHERLWQSVQEQIETQS